MVVRRHDKGIRPEIASITTLEPELGFRSELRELISMRQAAPPGDYDSLFCRVVGDVAQFSSCRVMVTMRLSNAA